MPSPLPHQACPPPPKGSERIAKSEVSGQQLKEAQAINRSLSALGDVIAALQARGGHVPYRNSKLTQVGRGGGAAGMCGGSKLLSRKRPPPF